MRNLIFDKRTVHDTFETASANLISSRSEKPLRTSQPVRGRQARSSRQPSTSGGGSLQEECENPCLYTEYSVAQPPTCLCRVPPAGISMVYPMECARAPGCAPCACGCAPRPPRPRRPTRTPPRNSPRRQGSPTRIYIGHIQMCTRMPPTSTHNLQARLCTQ